MKAFFDWLDHRTGYKKLAHEALYENVPGGARWRYVWGSALPFCIAAQFLTGIFLWMNYSPGVHTAWESVYYIQNEMLGGWLLRGLHHYTAQAMTILLVLHLMQVVIDGAYKAPREINFWFGLILLQLVLAIVAHRLPAAVGPKGLLGHQSGDESSGHRAGRRPRPSKNRHRRHGLRAAHADPLFRASRRDSSLRSADCAAWSGIFICFAVMASHAPRNPCRRPDAAFWPDQVLKDAIACLAVLAAVLFLILRHRIFRTAGAVGRGTGRARRSFRAVFRRATRVVVPVHVPVLEMLSGRDRNLGRDNHSFALIFAIMFLMPFIARLKFGHRFNIAFIVILLCGAAFLTTRALNEDRKNESYQLAVKESRRNADRVQALAHSPAGIPRGGAIELVRNDPFTQGPKLFAKHCSSCHRFDGARRHRPARAKDPQSASDLKGFGSRDWLAGLLDPARISTTNYFGGTKFKDTKMAKVRQEDRRRLHPRTEGAVEEGHRRAFGRGAPQRPARRRPARRRDHHGGRNAPARGDEMHRLPSVPRQGRKRNRPRPDRLRLARMAAEDHLEPGPSGPLRRSQRSHARVWRQGQILSPQEIGLLADWLRGDWYEPAETAAK